MNEINSIPEDPDLLDSEEDENFIYCLVGNVVPCHYYGVDKKIIRGTNLFLANAKVYVFPRIRDYPQSRARVIGLSRNKKRYIFTRMPIRLITNWRLQKVYKKKIIEIMAENHGWTNSEEDKAIIQRMGSKQIPVELNLRFFYNL